MLLLTLWCDLILSSRSRKLMSSDVAYCILYLGTRYDVYRFITLQDICLFHVTFDLHLWASAFVKITCTLIITRPYMLYGESIRFSLCVCLFVCLSVSEQKIHPNGCTDLDAVFARWLFTALARQTLKVIGCKKLPKQTNKQTNKGSCFEKWYTHRHDTQYQGTIQYATSNHISFLDLDVRPVKITLQGQRSYW